MKYLFVLALPLLVVAQPIEIDTIGGTTYDWAANGPAWRMVNNDPAYGVHAVWMYSADPGSTWPDRSMRSISTTTPTASGISLTRPTT